MGLFSGLIKRNFERRAPEPPSCRCSWYRINGINPKTGRRKTTRLLVGTWESLDAVAASRSGLLAPYEFQIDDPAPTEAQLDLMKKKRIPVPGEMSRGDASVLIQHCIDGDPVFPGPLPESFIRFAVLHGYALSSYFSKSEARNILLDAFPECSAEIKKL